MAGAGDEAEIELRRRIIAACIEMNDKGINQGTAGNISVRHGDGILITPTSLPYEDLAPEDLVWLGFDGRVEGRRQPSSESPFHLDILRAKSEANAVVHAHPTYATAISIMERSIPPIHYMVAIAGGHDIRCAPYATFGTAELSRHAVAALEGRWACLLAHHGMISTAPTLAKAMWLALEVETLARQFHCCLQIGEPPLLPEEEFDRVRRKMADYGHRD